ncbi:hypothetical protein [Paenibacillus sp. DR312]|uniref:hypothetical protein n=1 Tax=unclassified Paenibacillus TaxID=185978 RepID=UPI001C968576|nr:hypothetical protein [Paenibacillus sp. DR312]QZN75070.1 hypothetical protein K5K90_27415 [Paenibacillus sp. DR312]
MALQKPQTNFAAYIDGESEAQKLINTLADEIVGADIPRVEGGIDANRWEKVYEAEQDYWVTYTPKTRPNIQGKYLHTDGNLYDVIKIPDYSKLKFKDGTPAVEDDGFLHEVSSVYWDQIVEGSSRPAVREKDYGNYRTGRKIQVVQFSYTDKTGANIFVDVPNQLATLVTDLTKPDGVTAYIVKQKQTLSTGEEVYVNDWNEFELVTELPGDWNYSLKTAYQWEYVRYFDYYGDWTSLKSSIVEPGKSKYTFTERYYTADPVHDVPSRVVVKGTPTVPTGIPVREYSVMLEQPTNDWNYINIYYGEEFEGTNTSGDSTTTYRGACDPATVKPGLTPTVIDQAKAQAIYEMWNTDTIVKTFIPPSTKWKLDYDGKTEIVSPAARFFHGRHSTTSWLPNKKRRPDYLVAYTLSVNNDRVVLVLEGDPSPNIHSYYRSFGYIGKIVPFNDYDHGGNFGVTVGMGDLRTDMTGYTKNDILTDLNPDNYAKYGEYTSNGMDSMSMLKTRSNVLFQRYYPAFISHLPNYPSVGKLPPGLSKLIVDTDGFQKSLWTGKYHASPIYLVHQAEGYRGYMDGVVAIYDYNLVNRDELIVDTEILKDPSKPALGTWTEVYKFFSIKSPLNLFKHSPSPDVITIAFLKEIK